LSQQVQQLQPRGAGQGFAQPGELAVQLLLEGSMISHHRIFNYSIEFVNTA